MRLIGSLFFYAGAFLLLHVLHPTNTFSVDWWLTTVGVMCLGISLSFAVKLMRGPRGFTGEAGVPGPPGPTGAPGTASEKRS